MADGCLGKCKQCSKLDALPKIEGKCMECGSKLLTTQSEITRGGGKLCSRKCYYIYQRKTIKRGEESHAWKGEKVGKTALHNWVERQLGKPKICWHCGSKNKKKYEWANKSQEYKRDVDDWLRLCTLCHAKYDKPVRVRKWKNAVTKLGWKVKIIS
jgi:hypothetical protein